MIRMRFRDFLKEKFCNQYHGLDDEMPDAQVHWESNLDFYDLVEYAEEWGHQQRMVAIDTFCKKLQEPK